MSKPIFAQTGVVVGGEKDAIHAFRLQSSVFISSYNEAKKAGFAGHFSEAQLTAKGFVSLVRKMVSSPDQCLVKIVGPQKLCLLATGKMKECGAKGVKATAVSHDVQIFFYSETGRVRMESESAKKVEPAKKIRVLLVDDSKTIRDLLQKILTHDPMIEVVATTGQPLEVMDLVARLKPDVITMDIQMPDKDGVTLVKEVMARFPTPTVMITAASMADGPAVLTAIENGAVDYIQKPNFNEIDAMIPIIIEKVKTAARANLQKAAAAAPRIQMQVSMPLDLQSLIVIGSSTGGTEALRVLLTQLPKDIPPILIVQHIPPVFSDAFAKRMDSLCPFRVKEAADGDLVQPGHVLVAPGGKQMEIKARGNGFIALVTDGPAVNRHKPSVDVLFESVATTYKGRVMAVILTGMGADGAKGMLKLKELGAHTIAQSERTCVVFGMPREAIELGGAIETLDLDRIPEAMVRQLSRKKAA